MKITPKGLEAAAWALALPVMLGCAARVVVDAYTGDDRSLLWIGASLAAAALGWRSWLAQRDRVRTVADQLTGTVAAISVDDTGDGRDSYLVKNKQGEAIFTMRAAPGRYAIGEKLTMRQWVERR